MTALQVTWFLLVGVLLTGYAILDGFDLGVGIWFLKAKRDKERTTLMRAIGPVWDGNEVWLLTGGGAIFAAFPPVYASVFSGFYLAMMLVVLVLMARAVSLEFRHLEANPLWRSTWDVVFSISSVLAGLLFGVALGNILRGIPLDAKGNYTGTFLGLLNPYALVIGILAVAMFAFHGANYIVLKTTGELEKKGRKWAFLSGIVYVILFVIGSVYTIFLNDHLLSNFNEVKVLWLIPLVALVSISASLFFGKREEAGKAFLFSSVSIGSLMGLVGAGLFPRLVPALGNPKLSLTVANSSSSELTLKTMFIMALIGVPVVLGYTIWIYRAFAGKVNPDETGGHY